MKKPTHAEALAILLEQVRTKLGWDTLETRRSDRLDFHEVSADQINEIVRLAFNAGADHCAEQMAGG